MVIPYLPDIIQNCASRVNTSFSTRSTDPFEVFFDKGLFAEVRKNVYKAQQNFPLNWFVMKWYEDHDRKKNGIGVYCSASFDIIIAMPSENTYSQQQRDDISFKPRLLPIYEMMKFEINREGWFKNNGPSGQDHRMIVAPYSGQGEPNGTDVTNLFKNTFYDAVIMQFKEVKILERQCAPYGGYSVANANTYPLAPGPLKFFDDLELIVDGDNENDPVAGEDSVIIAYLIGKQYEVYQRVIGQLRQRRSVEIVINEINGGFQLQGGLKFIKGETYFVKIRPAYVL